MLYMPFDEFDPINAQMVKEEFEAHPDHLVRDVACKLMGVPGVIPQVAVKGDLYIPVFCYGARAFEYMQIAYCRIRHGVREAEELCLENLSMIVTSVDLADEHDEKEGVQGIYVPLLVISYTYGQNKTEGVSVEEAELQLRQMLEAAVADQWELPSTTLTQRRIS